MTSHENERVMYPVIFIFLVFGSFNPLEAVIEEYLNPSVNPCDDFHQYACGKWNDVNKNVKYGDTLNLLDATMNIKVSELLESKRENGVLGKMKAFYESCRNLDVYNMSLFLDAVKPKSDWPISSLWNEKEFSWLHTIAELRKFGAQIFLEQTVMPRWDNSSVNFIYLDIVKFHPSSAESLKAILQKASLNDSMAEEIIEFEKQLAEILPKADTPTDNDDSEEVVLGYLGEAVPQINWTKYFSTVFGQEIDLYTPMIVQKMEIMSKLAEFLDKSRPISVSNYIMIKFLQFVDQHSIDDTSPNQCVTALHQAMPLAVDYTIENQFYDHDHDQVVQDLFNYLKVEFLAGVSKLYENHRDVLLFIYTKVSVMDLQIGNSDRNLTSEAVTKYYEGLEITKVDFYLNLLTAFKYKTHKDLESLKGEPINIAYQWTVTPSPFFLQPKNRIVVPLTLLQETVFGKESTDKYSVLGFIIGHEFLHGFDLNGVNYDYTGAMVESALSRNPSFFKRVQCVQEEMGATGIGEKIADIGGVRLAYNALQRSLMQVGQNITGKEGTKRPLGQSFFIDYAQFFCGDSEKVSKGLPRPDAHDADELRIKRTLMHFEEFSTAFECPIGSAMNPKTKCRVW